MGTCHSYLWRDSFMFVGHDSFTYVTWRIYMCEVPHSHVWHASWHKPQHTRAHTHCDTHTHAHTHTHTQTHTHTCTHTHKHTRTHTHRLAHTQWHSHIRIDISTKNRLSLLGFCFWVCKLASASLVYIYLWLYERSISVYVLHINFPGAIWCCSALQRVAVCCSVLQCVAACVSVRCKYQIKMPAPFWSGYVLQCVVVCCSVRWAYLSHQNARSHVVWQRCSVLQCVAVRCSALQYVAACCSVLQCANAETWCIFRCLLQKYTSVLQCVAVCCIACSVLLRRFDAIKGLFCKRDVLLQGVYMYIQIYTYV